VKKIDTENHFATEAYVDALYANPGYPRFVDDKETGERHVYHSAEYWQPFGDPLVDRLLDLDHLRLQSMDAIGIDVAVLSHTAPALEQLEPRVATTLARDANDKLAEAIDRHPDRYLGFATLGPREPEEAVKELERAVKELGFKGWNTHSNFGDSYLDDKRYWPILAKAAELGVPIYLHPTFPMIRQLTDYGLALAGPGFGFGIETSTVMMRLILSGVFDTFPTLTIVLGHYGEALPFLLRRVDRSFLQYHVPKGSGSMPAISKRPSQYLLENMYVTTSGNFFAAAFECTRTALGIERIMLGTDYPYETTEESGAFLDGLGLSDEEQAKLYEENAAKLGFALSG
jgi:predicted TIM-barrel fold metal-dependent hydrolase